MFGLPFQPPSPSIAAAQARALPFVETAIAAAASGNFEESEKGLLSGKACYIQSDLSNYCNVEAHFTEMFAGWRSQVEKARAKWEEGAPARAAEWEKGAPARKAAEEVARLKAEIARVEQEEVDRQAALAKEAALEKLRIQNEEEEKQQKAEVTSLERDAAALREKLAAMKELMAMKAADPLAYAAVCTSLPSPPSPLRSSPVDFGDAPEVVAFHAQDFMSKAQFRKLRERVGFPLHAHQHVCHIIAESNGGANHIDNFYVAAGSLNQSLGNKNDAYLAEAAGIGQTRKAVAVSRSTGYTGPGADELIAMAKAARA
jgi:hypothetical protein